MIKIDGWNLSYAEILIPERGFWTLRCLPFWGKVLTQSCKITIENQTDNSKISVDGYSIFPHADGQSYVAIAKTSYQLNQKKQSVASNTSLKKLLDSAGIQNNFLSTSNQKILFSNQFPWCGEMLKYNPNYRVNLNGVVTDKPSDKKYEPLVLARNQGDRLLIVDGGPYEPGCKIVYQSQTYTCKHSRLIQKNNDFQSEVWY